MMPMMAGMMGAGTIDGNNMMMGPGMMMNSLTGHTDNTTRPHDKDLEEKLNDPDLDRH